jgi:hypothetical protein
MFKGAMHIHSTYSDGEFTLPELREVFLAERCAFVCMKIMRTSTNSRSDSTCANATRSQTKSCSSSPAWNTNVFSLDRELRNFAARD